MKDLIIVGAGGFAREAYYVAKALNVISPRWNIKGFLSDIPLDLKTKKIDLPILGTIEDWCPADNECFAMGISSPYGKEKVANKLKSKGARFVTLVSPEAKVNETVEMGEGCVVTGLGIGDCSRLGDFVHVAGSLIGQDVYIGDYSTTTGFANIATDSVGRRTTIWSHAVILKNVGDDCVVVAGSVVTRKVPDGLSVYDTPLSRNILPTSFKYQNQ